VNKRSAERWWDYQEIHPHVKKIDTRNRNNPESHLCRAVRYLAKEDPANVGLKEYGQKSASFVDMVLGAPTLLDAMRLDRNPAHWGGISTAYAMRGPSMREMPDWLHGWQSELFAELEETPDHRTIQWIFDKKGGGGKTFFTKKVCSEEPGKYTMVNVCATSRDFATIVKNAMDSGWSSHCIIFNIARATRIDAPSLYQTLEMIKDGMITATKYNGKAMIFDSPHVVVFSNEEPTYSKMSFDRWFVRELVDFRLNIIKPKILPAAPLTALPGLDRDDIVFPI